MMDSNWLKVINQIFEIQKKNQDPAIERHIARIYKHLEDLNLKVHNPLGEPYSETRTDCVANILENATQMRISEVVKPIIYQEEQGLNLLLQQAVVIVN